MGFLDLFKPKWRHSDAQVRAEAVKQLAGDDAALLKKIVEGDPDVRVRRIALKKIDDWALLGELAENDPDEGLRKDAGDKAAELLVARAIADDEAKANEALARLKIARGLAEVARRASLPSVRQAALEKLDDAKSLAEVARRAEDAQIRLAAVARVSEVSVLRDVAIHDAVKEVALAAVARVDEREALELINKKCKSKAVKAAAREKIDAHKKEDEPQAELRGRQAELCRTVESAAAGHDFDEAAQEIEGARAEWEALGTAHESLQRRFERALGRFRERREEHLRKTRGKRAEAEVQVKRALDEAIAPAPSDDRAAPPEPEKIRQPEKAREPELSPEEAARRAEDQALRDAERARRADEKRARDEERARKDAEKAEERKRKDEEAQKNVERLVELANQLEALAGTDDRKRGEKALKDAQAALSSLGSLPRDAGEVRARFQTAREKLHIRVQELRDADDWKRWANVPRLEALCARMEALIAVEDLKQAGADLKALQAEWKTVGAAPKEKSETLWQRFKKAGDAVYERVKVVHAAADEARQGNLKKKEELCARVEALADSTDWKETAETIKALQEEWKGVGQVPKEQADAIWKRFREACDKFFDRRKEHFAQLDGERAQNLKQQEILITRVAALADSTDWRGAAEQIKAAQAEWKELGPAPKEHAEGTWRRFREACDRFFDRRKEHFAKLDAERAESSRAREALIGLAEGLIGEADRASVGERVKKLQAEWRELGPAPKDEADELNDRFKVACDSAVKGKKPPEPQAPPVEKGPPKKFENKLPLGDLAQKLAAATAEAKPAEKPVEKKAEPKPVESKVEAKPAEKPPETSAVDAGWAELAAEEPPKK